MSRLAATMRLDVRLQGRSRLYAIGVVVAVLLGVPGRALFAPEHAGRLLPAFYLLGIGGTTYMFGASMLLLEKSEGTLQAIRVSPLGAREYLASKAVTLTAFACIEGAIVFAFVYRGGPVAPLPLAAGVAALGVFYTLVGVGQAARHDSVTAFLIPDALVVSAVLQLPFLYVLDLGPTWLWLAVPTFGPLLLMLGAFEALPAWQWAYAIAMTIGAVGLAGWFALTRFRRHVGLR